MHVTVTMVRFLGTGDIPLTCFLLQYDGPISISWLTWEETLSCNHAGCWHFGIGSVGYLHLGNSTLHTKGSSLGFRFIPSTAAWPLPQACLLVLSSFLLQLFPHCCNSPAAFQNAESNLLNICCKWFVLSHQLTTRKNGAKTVLNEWV